ncbi:hypothetical protein LWI29_023311 [Acer saccharum]|uniref:MATH domain-containing protein n=1 Tax=Acer saccharum TaxID=4024 RepID=A0AA39RSQ9_ACESA|nr:hypothetical protein LWI29_023311 [Acer saccharum]
MKLVILMQEATNDAKGAVKHFDELRNEYGFAELLSLDEFNDPNAKGAVKYFDQLRTKHGFVELLSLHVFNDPSNGYLVNDRCVFGAEVLVIQPSTGSEETITMVTKLDDSTYTWSIKDFSNLNEDDQYSDAFTVDAKGAAKYFDKLRTEHGFAELFSLEEFNDPCNGYLVNDCCVFGVEVSVIQPSTSSEETITMVKELVNRTYTWSIHDFSNLNENDLSSDEFTVGGRKWFTYISHFSCTIMFSFNSYKR